MKILLDEAHRFGLEQVISKIPFSFRYGGRSSDDFLLSWEMSQETKRIDDVKALHIIRRTDPQTRLEVISEFTEFSDFPAVEWIIYFKNTGNVDTPILENINALDIMLPSKGEYIIHHINGSQQMAADFAPVADPVSQGMKLSAGCVGGRSSNGGYPPSHLGGSAPFFNLEEVGANRGVMLAIGWTGQWLANFEHDFASTMHVKAGMELTHLKLFLGECIRTPRILLLFWEGSEYLLGNNLLRRFIAEHKLPRIDGKPIQVPIGANTWLNHNGGNGVTEQNQIEFARQCTEKKLGIEYYWLDAGWFEGGWPYGVGNWFARKDAFPHGLKGLSDAVKKMGLKFILWFEPERVCPDTQLWRDYPEWLLPQQNPPGKQGWTEHKFSLLNLGNTEARTWLTEHISRMITKCGIDCYRQDFNVDPLPLWRYADAEDRQGITEIRYIEGLYAFWDELLARHSDLIIDCCASGGRRIDLETISRSTNLCRSDYSVEPIGMQCHTYGLNLFVPGHAGGTANINKVNKYEFRSLLSGGATIAWDLEQPNFSDEEARRLIAEVKQLRPLFYGDFWPLTPCSLSKNCWIAWQFERPDLGKGAVFAFRRSELAVNTMKFILRGIKPRTNYEVTFVDRDMKKIFSGKELMEAGIEIEMFTAPGSALITYKQVCKKK